MPHLINPSALTGDQIETTEKVSQRYVYQSVWDFAREAVEIFANSPDKAKDVAEDVTREALGRYPGFPLGARIFGTMDFKRAGYVFLPEFAVRQALLVDSKAELTGNVARLQMSQTSLPVRYVTAGGVEVIEQGELPTEVLLRGDSYLTTTIFVHYHYRDVTGGGRELIRIRVAACPNNRIGTTYVPDARNTIWVVGPHSPLNREKFRGRLSFHRLKRVCPWRVQEIIFRYGSPGGTLVEGDWSE